MKRLNKLLLIHWHYFTHEVIEFDILNFLTGKNASGKSTIIDAIQLVLLGDTSGNFFNKAANVRGNRTLMGYLKGELGDDEESGFKYLRNGRFTSYIALEFYDEEKKKSFTAGCCFDVYSENDMKKLFFLYDGPIPNNEFVSNEVPVDIIALRAFIKEKYSGHCATDVGRTFAETLRGKMGGLRERFGSLFKKAVSFNPNVEIQQFISEFVCDVQQTVDISQMQDNIRSYKRLEEEADVLKQKISLLEQIMTTHQSFERAKQDEQMYTYLISCAKTEMKSGELCAAEAKSNNLTQQLVEIEETILATSVRLEALQNERNELQARLLNDEQAQALQLIETQIAEKTARIEALCKDYEKTVSLISSCISSWNTNIGAMLSKTDIPNGTIFDPLLISRINDICGEGRRFLAQLQDLRELDENSIIKAGEDGLSEYIKRAKQITEHTIALKERIAGEQSRLGDARKSLQEEQQSLEGGIYRFPQDAIDLKEAISSRLRTSTGADVKVLIVAEAAEIKNDRWRNAIEGYLNSQKYNIIVPPEHFGIALRVFDSIKSQRALYGTGLVDIEKLKRKNPTIDPGSLVEEIETDDANVRVFLDFTLGWVHKSDRVGDLRRYRTAVTDDGMLYQNYVVRAMNPNRWAKPAIGQGAILKRLEAVKAEIAVLLEQISLCASIKTGLQYCGDMHSLSPTEISQAIVAAKAMSEVPTLQGDVLSLKKSRDAIDQSAINALQERIDTLDVTLKELGKQLDGYKDERGTKREKLRACTEETLPALAQQLSELEDKMNDGFGAAWVQSVGDLRYQREMSIRNSAEDINKAFPRELSRSTNARAAMWDDLQTYRRDYNTKYIMGYDIKTEDNEVYDNAWLELSDNKLPDYLLRIEDTRKKAFEQFQEDFLSRLQNNIMDTGRQIDGLNTALKGSSFGEETFRFRIIPRPEYKRYYDMIVDPMLLEGGYNLLTEQFNAKYKDEIAELFAIITNDNTSGKMSAHEDYEKRVQMFTDYKTYLTFDLESMNREGEAQRLSKTMGKKSGGETQTPFYIAVLASFAQLYRSGRDKSQSTARLIIFDEAFSKMDGERIVKSVELLRQFNFQVILSAPTEKIGDIGTLVDRNLCVLREGKRTCVKAFDPRKAEVFADE